MLHSLDINKALMKGIKVRLTSHIDMQFLGASFSISSILHRYSAYDCFTLSSFLGKKLLINLIIR